MADDGPILIPGQSCWQIAHAGRVGVIIDAADYFAAVRAAILQARHSVLLIGWDFDVRIQLDPRNPRRGMPDRLGRFLDWAVRKRPGLRIHVLRWDLGMVMGIWRGAMPLMVLDWLSNDRISFRLDRAHPIDSVHHEKIIVIDDALAFCGGIDMTCDRWDTRAHRDDEPFRKRPLTRRPYGPWHDVATAVDGAAAKALGDLARMRWKRATGQDLPVPPPGADIWPDDVDISFRDSDIAIARTNPPWNGEDGVREIEALYLHAIASARRMIYLESQYFASRRIAEAIAARLRAADPPEIVIINPHEAGGWLEEAIMGASRVRLLRMVLAQDHQDRFRIYTPVTEGGAPIYVHAKVMVIDDRLLRVGSSNLNNRSLGVDTECDLAIEASDDDTEKRARIIALRDDLLAEHLGCSPDDIAAAIADAGSLIGAIERLCGPGRSLRPFEPPDLGDLTEAVLGENELLDPESLTRRWPRLRRRISRILRGKWRRAPRSPH